MPNYNNRNKRYNGGYNRNNNRYNNGGYNYNRNNQNAAQQLNVNEEFNLDFLPLAKPDIKIRDYRGNIYVIPGDFTTDFIASLTKYVEKVQDFKNKSSDPTIFPEWLKVLKEFCLEFINLNVDGTKYTMEDVNRGFNNIDALNDILNFAANRAQDTLNNSKVVKMANNK